MTLHAAKTRRCTRSGIAIVYVVIVMSVAFAFASLAMDFGRVQLAKTQLRTAIDSAARYGVQWVPGGKNQTLVYCNAAVADNPVNGQTLSFGTNDIDIGNWDTQTRVFTANAYPRNAVRLAATAQIPLAWGQFIGMNSCTIRNWSIAKAVPLAIVGYNGINFKNKAFAGSYNSSVTTSPTRTTCNANGSLASNGYIGEQNNGEVQGDCIVGPSGSVDPTFTVSGGTTTLGSALVPPADPAWNPSGNPGGIPYNYTVGSATSLAGGTYYFTSLTVNKPLTFSGAATFYVHGNIDFNDAVTAYQSIPANLKIYQMGNNRTFDGKESLKAVVIAPNSAFTAQNSFKFFGACQFKTITVMNNAEFYYDESIGLVTGAAIVR